jgi:hypothetical protein
MKRLLFFIGILIMQIQANAAWRNTMIRLRHEMGRTISITIDGRKYNKIGRSITVSDLPPGNHRIKIYKYNSNGYGYSNGILIYQGNLQTRPGRIYYLIASNSGLDIEENCCIDDYGHWNNDENWDREERWEQRIDDGDMNWNNNQRWDNDRDRNRNRNRDQNDRDWGNFNGQMSEGRFSQLIEQVRKASFETAKVSVAKQALRDNRISCNQLLRILNELSFESTKLQFAKDAYNSVVDRNNYYLINDAFTFQSSKEDLMDHINKVGR